VGPGAFRVRDTLSCGSKSLRIGLSGSNTSYQASNSSPEPADRKATGAAWVWGSSPSTDGVPGGVFFALARPCSARGEPPPERLRWTRCRNRREANGGAFQVNGRAKHHAQPFGQPSWRSLACLHRAESIELVFAGSAEQVVAAQQAGGVRSTTWQSRFVAGNPCPARSSVSESSMSRGFRHREVFIAYPVGFAQEHGER